MSYTWLKEFYVDVREVYPYFKVYLKILPPKSWSYPAPFYTFAVNLKVDGAVFGWYLYVGDFVSSVLEPGKEFIVNASLRLLDIHAVNHRNKWRELASVSKELKIEAGALVYLLNYQSTISTSNRVPASRVLEWINREGTLRNDFIPLPSPSAPQEVANAVAIANVALLYREVLGLKRGLATMIDEKLRKLEPLIAIFEYGLDNYRKRIEAEVKYRYSPVEPILTLVEVLKNASNDTLDENWALSTLVLAAIENFVNMKLKELGESVSGDFKACASRLKEVLIKKGGWDEREASDLARRLRGKYEERHVIIHGGYENPTTREAALEDLEFLKDVLKKLFEWAENA